MVAIRDVLALEVLQRAGIRVVAGEELLDRQVEWVHTGEIADIARYLRGGEVLLTAATGLGRSDRAYRHYIRELAGVGVVALIVELGRTFKRIPSAMRDEAEAQELVLVELEREVPFEAVTREVHASIVTAHREQVDDAMRIGDAVAELVLDGADLPSMLTFLASRLHNPVVLEDGARHVVEVGRWYAPVGPVLEAWRTHSRSGHHAERTATVELADSVPRCAWTSIVLKGEIWGRLHVLEVDEPLDATARLALGRAAASVALHLLAERDAKVLEAAAERSLIRDLASGRSFSGEEFLARASGLGVRLGDEVVVVATGPEARDAREAGAVEAQATAVRDALRDARWPGVVSALDELAVAAVAARPDQGLTRALADLAERVGSRWPALALGVSRPTSPQHLPRALAEAQTAHRLGRVEDDAMVHRYEDLTFYRLLAPLMQGPELANFVESEIGPLVDFDARHSSELVRTLRVYLSTNGSKTTTAGLLHLQRRSVYHRLARIEELLGRSVDTPEDRARLYIALRANDMLVAREGGSAVRARGGAPARAANGNGDRARTGAHAAGGGS